jgi:hypothetical protein
MDNFIFLGNYNTEHWMNKLNTLTDEDWNNYTFRQDTYKVHNQTKTIPILYDETYSVFRGKKTIFYDMFESDVDELRKLYNSILGVGNILRIEIVSMPAYSEVLLHKDSGGSLETHNRTHIPLQTSKGCIFTVGKDSKHLKVGEIWEINNGGERHGVINDSNVERIHMIIDFKKDNINTLI